MVNYERDLTKNESLMIQLLSCSKVSITHIATSLESMYENRAYTPVLLKRLRQKHLHAKYGEDMHDLPSLFKKCNQVKAEGGVFEIVPSPQDFGFKSIHFQTKLMHEYAVIYSELRIADGTHALSQYDFVFVIFCTIDCLLRTVITGVTSHFSENSEAIIEGVNHLYPTEMDSSNVVKLGEIPRYYCPFTDSSTTIPKQQLDSVVTLLEEPSLGAGTSDQKKHPYSLI